eukprot:CAMPEP_0184496364 /NCGR_PEP_ID=MMETSP0113_2-20130426/33762_1 /TAXON_ID=91329 /ORGANISM="Norrisiella sphaerica, Strain BC52" /LENGTH=43 /DNA_ID= /DNA_START= /DNA_END= /DNA_ORIENTATION=
MAMTGIITAKVMNCMSKDVDDSEEEEDVGDDVIVTELQVNWMP